MVISGIDEGFVDIINYLDSKGFCPYSSCDGVLEHHRNRYRPNKAYIGFLKSRGIIDLMAAFLRDRSNFCVSISSSTYTYPYEYYGNTIKGNTYQVSFNNLQGELTEYFKKITRATIDKAVSISDEERKKLIRLDKCLEQTETSGISFNIIFNREYQPYTRKSGRTNCLTIRTKHGLGYNRNMQKLAQIISERFGIPLRKDNYGEDFESVDEFIVPQFDKCSLEYSFKDEDISRVIEIIKLARAKEKSLESIFIRRDR